MSMEIKAVCETCGRRFYSLAFLPGFGKRCDQARCGGFLHHIERGGRR